MVGWIIQQLLQVVLITRSMSVIILIIEKMLPENILLLNRVENVIYLVFVIKDIFNYKDDCGLKKQKKPTIESASSEIERF